MTIRAPLEKTVQANIRSAFAKHGALVVKVPGGKYGANGVSDLIVLYQGRYLACEIKRPGWTRSDVTELQRRFLERVQEHGGEAYVVDTKEAVPVILNGLEREREVYAWQP